MPNLNFCRHAIDSLKKQDTPKLFQSMPQTSAALPFFVGTLEKAVKFILPKGGRLIDTKGFDQKTIDLLRLPYKIIACEYEAASDTNMAVDASVRSSSRIALAFDSSYFNELYGQEEEPGVFVFSVSYYDDIDQWSLPYAGMFIPYDQIVKKAKDAKEDGSLYVPQTTLSGYQYTESKKMFTNRVYPIG